MPLNHIRYHLRISWTCFIMHGPPTIHQLKLAVHDEFFHLILLLLLLKAPPHGQVLHLTPDKLSLGVVQESINDRR